MVHLDISFIFAHVSHLKTYGKLKFIYSLWNVYLVVLIVPHLSVSMILSEHWSNVTDPAFISLFLNQHW